MKAAVLHAKNDLRYEEYPTPEIKPGHVKIAVKMTGICGSDVPRVLGDESRYFPNVLGHEFSGDVVEVGEGVNRIKVGQKATAAPLKPCHQCEDCTNGNFALCKQYSFIGSREQGSLAEYIVVPEINVVPFDDTVSYEKGALFEPSTVGAHGVLLNNMKPGGWVAVLGGGNIGLFTAQWARILGAEKVVVFDIDDTRLALAEKLGVDETINTLEKDFRDKAEKITQGKGFNYVFETAGVTPTMHLAFELAANKANVCFIGTPHKDLCFSPKQWENMNRKELCLTGSWMSYSAPFPGKEWVMTAEKFKSGELKFDDGLIYKRFPLKKAAEAFKLFENPNTVKGKVLLINDEKKQGDA